MNFVFRLISYGTFPSFLQAIDFLNGKDKRGRDFTPTSPSSSESSAREEKPRDHRDGDEEEFEKFAQEIKGLPFYELERDIAETDADIEFLEAQVKIGLKDYSPRDLESANARISLLKRKADLMKHEFARKAKTI